MLHSDDRSADRPVLFCLHYLGGSAREWGSVFERLEDRYRCVPIDLAGFGDAAHVAGYTVAEMVRAVAVRIRDEAPDEWYLVGHSMGAKVATVLTRFVEDGAERIAGLAGVILVAGSPPCPEPMPSEQRETMLTWFAGDESSNRDDAMRYVANNSGPKLDDASRDVAVGDALRANRAAWRAWLLEGSREDWASRVGVLRTPALVVAGADDENLGPDAQERLTTPHFSDVRSLTLAGAKHLLPMESPAELAAAIDGHATFGRYRALIDSRRVGSGTRRALLERGQPDDPAYRPGAMSAPAFATLRAMLDRVIPQTHAVRIDLAARIDRQLASGAGDGWRFASLPPDAEAYRAGLATLEAIAERRHGVAFASMNEGDRDGLLAAIARTDALPPDLDARDERLTAEQMRAWFEDVRADAVKLYVAHPETLARMGYGGIANGGDGMPKTGFVRVGLDERETWEPVAPTNAAR